MQVSDNKDANVGEALKSFREDDIVKAVVLSVDLRNRKISFGIKPSYFNEEDFEMGEASDSEEKGSEEGNEREGDDDAEGDEEEGSDEAGEDDSSIDSDDEVGEVRSTGFFNVTILNLLRL